MDSGFSLREHRAVPVPEDNPAGRLHNLLYGFLVTPDGEEIENTLRRYLQLEDADTAEVVEELAVASRWPQQAREQIEALPNINQALYLGWEPQVDDAMKWLYRWGNHVNDMKTIYDHATLTSLAFTAELLHREGHEPSIEEDKLPDVIALVRDIIDAVSESHELPADARRFLVDRLQEVERALIHFRIVGYAGVEDAMDRLLGGIIRLPVTHDNAKGWLPRLFGSIKTSFGATKQIADTGTAVAGAIEAGKNLLGG